MAAFITKRLLEFIPVLLAIITITFFLIRLAPGGPFDTEKRVSPEVLAQLEAHYQMDRPLHAQYFQYLKGLIRLDFGPSYKKPARTVAQWLLLRLPVSIELGLYGLAFALFLGLGAGVLAALKPNSWLDHTVMSVAML
ncbi:MAG TPA: ABC transporter, partial [Candidatus Hydrogenedentes bacterium]|nr:ABC transporter [Candidatus Hydrogenedentota bacterium]